MRCGLRCVTAVSIIQTGPVRQMGRRKVNSTLAGPQPRRDCALFSRGRAPPQAGCTGAGGAAAGPTFGTAPRTERRPQSHQSDRKAFLHGSLACHALPLHSPSGRGFSNLQEHRYHQIWLLDGVGPSESSCR